MQVLKRLRKAGYNFRNVVIVGCNQMGLELERFINADLSFGYRLLGYFDECRGEGIENYLGKVSDLKQYLTINNVHEVYIAGSAFDEKQMIELTNFCESNLIRIKFVPDFRRFTMSRRVHVDFYGNIPVVFLRQEPLERISNRILKRSFDFIFSLIITLAIIPILFPIIVLLIKLTSKGPVFFVQQRSGEGNQPFPCIKFRTMHENEDSDTKQASIGDERITKVGKILRKYNLDELPQFINVLAGQMTVVGPRPHMLQHTEDYSKLVEHYLVRHINRPGITGWAQVNGLRGETKNVDQMKKRVEYDIWYIENWSFLLDLKIIWKTLVGFFIPSKNAR